VVAKESLRRENWSG